MTEPSEAAMREARGIVDSIYDFQFKKRPIWAKNLDTAIALALDRHAAAERERCAMIAHGYPMIAAAIRRQPTHRHK